jgi:integrase
MDPAMTFRAAVPAWLKEHKQYIKPRTLHDYLQYQGPLLDFFGAEPLEAITIDRIRAFQRWRSSALRGPGPESKYRHAAGNSRLKGEINCILKPILREAGLWAGIEKMKFKHLPVSHMGSGHALTPAEVGTLLGIAFSNAKWVTAAHCLRLMFNTGCGFGEVRHLRRRDIDLEQQTLCISEDGAKNQARMRTVPLTPEASESIAYLLARWQRLGGMNPDDFILPHRSEIGEQTPNFAHTMTSINASFMAIRKAAVPVLGEKINKFRIYDCRVTAITWVLSSGKISLLTAERLFGHISIQMQRRYFKPDIDTMREAVAVLGVTQSKPEDSAKQRSIKCVRIDEALKQLPRKATAAVAGFLTPPRKAENEI